MSWLVKFKDKYSTFILKTNILSIRNQKGFFYANSNAQYFPSVKTQMTKNLGFADLATMY